MKTLLRIGLAGLIGALALGECQAANGRRPSTGVVGAFGTHGWSTSRSAPRQSRGRSGSGSRAGGAGMPGMNPGMGGMGMGNQGMGNMGMNGAGMMPGMGGVSGSSGARSAQKPNSAKPRLSGANSKSRSKLPPANYQR